MKLKGKDYYALLCDCSKYGGKDMLICGVYGGRKEAEEANKKIRSCPARHKIRRCSVEVKLH